MTQIDTTYSQEKHNNEAYSHFVSLITTENKVKHKEALAYLAKNWQQEFNIIAIELAYLTRQRVIESNLILLLEKNTQQSFGYNYNQWYQWLWNQEQKLIPSYHKLKALLHRVIDARFITYFVDRQETATIRLDEIRWGGVQQDGIPPLRNPKMLKASEARYLEEDNVVFGIAINGDFRAYPKRILAWHEMFTDTVGGIPVAGVYCTLCGTVILYKTEQNGVNYRLGTSGFLYRSNKLMYDQKTQSLWNTILGKPVVGPLVGKNIELAYLSTVTTTWGEWKRLHPETTVLDIHTGHHRDYGEGVAYQSYFATDKLMFNVPQIDTSLKNKQSILAIRLPELSDESIAISVDYLKKNPIYHDKISDLEFVVLTDHTGANRVFKTNGLRIKEYNQKQKFVVDETSKKWIIEENQLKSGQEIIERLHSFNAFWFGWKATHPNTRLIK